VDKHPGRFVTEPLRWGQSPGVVQSWVTREGGLALPRRMSAVRVTGALFHTQGGLAVDGRAAVLGAGGQALPNLFAAGGAACGVSGRAASGYLSGNGLLSAVALGHRAGQAAAGALQSGVVAKLDSRKPFVTAQPPTRASIDQAPVEPKSVGGISWAVRAASCAAFALR